MTPQELTFLKESNAIEGVYDDDSLKQAVFAWEYLKKERELTPGVVLKTHKILMLNQRLRPDEKGYFRKCQVYVGGREGLEWPFIPGFIEAWCAASMTLATIITPVDLHIAYEKIHPFVDGNGRTGRMFLNWTRLKITEEPLLIIKASERQDYYQWFVDRKI